MNNCFEHKTILWVSFSTWPQDGSSRSDRSTPSDEPNQASGPQTTEQKVECRGFYSRSNGQSAIVDPAVAYSLCQSARIPS